MPPRPCPRTHREPASSGLPTRPYHPTFLSRSVPVIGAAVLEVADHAVLFFAFVVHELEVTKDGNVDDGENIDFSISAVASLFRPTTLWHLGNTAPGWRSPKCTRAGAWSICRPCDGKLCPLCNYACLHAFSKNSQNFAQNSYKFGMNECPGQVCECRSCFSIRASFCEFVQNVHPCVRLPQWPLYRRSLFLQYYPQHFCTLRAAVV